MTCRCSAEAVSNGPVWGSGIYTADSRLCRAALHAGAVGPDGGTVTVEPAPGREAYIGTDSHGVRSEAWGHYDTSYRFAGVRAAGPAPDAVAAPPARGPAPAAACPGDFREVAASSHSITCACSPEAAADGSVWGTDVYTADSKICRAALHAGAIGADGGTVTVVGEPGRAAYRGVRRNGVASESWGAFEASYRFAMSGAAPTTTSIADCPDSFSEAAGNGEPLTCTCPPEATSSGSVWGTGIYTADSKVCRAAVHAGAIGPDGGTVMVVAAPGRRRYTGSSRNGVRTGSWGAFQSSFRFAPVGERR